MRDDTRRLKEEMQRDAGAMRYGRCRARMTPEQIEQSRADRVRYYTQKWQALQKDAKTEAQKRYCEIMIHYAQFAR